MVNNFSEIQHFDDEITEIGLRQRKTKEKRGLQKAIYVQEQFQKNQNFKIPSLNQIQQLSNLSNVKVDDVEKQSQIEIKKSIINHENKLQSIVYAENESLLSLEDNKGESLDTYTIIKQILNIMMPSMINLFLQEGLLQINIIYAGKLNNDQMLAGMGLANTLINCTTISITYGLSGVLETFVSQSFGSKQYQLCGVHLNRQIFLITCLFVPLGIILFFSEYIMSNFLGQSIGPSHHCQVYMRVGIIGLYLECIVNSLAFFFTAMQRSFVPMLIQLISLPVHLAGCYIFVNYFEMGLDGLALSLNITYALSLISIYFVVKFSNDPIIQQVWVPFNKEIFFEFRSFLSMAISGLLITSFEEWCNQGLQIISGFLGESNQATMVISFNLMQCIFVIPMCIGFAISALVGAAIGQGDIRRAKKITYVAFVFSVTVLLSITFILQFVSYDIAKIYTDSEEMALRSSQNFLIYTYIFTIDGIQINLQSVIKALGLQEQAQNTALFSYFFVCLPMAYILSVKMEYGIDGLWFGLLVALILLIVHFSNLVYSQDWNAISIEIREDICKQVENQKINAPLETTLAADKSLLDNQSNCNLESFKDQEIIQQKDRTF